MRWLFIYIYVGHNYYALKYTIIQLCITLLWTPLYCTQMRLCTACLCTKLLPKKFGWNVILIIAIRKIVNSREWHFGFYVCRILAFRDFITSRFRHLGGLTSSHVPYAMVHRSVLQWTRGERVPLSLYKRIFVAVLRFHFMTACYDCIS